MRTEPPVPTRIAQAERGLGWVRLAGVAFLAVLVRAMPGGPNFDRRLAVAVIVLALVYAAGVLVLRPWRRFPAGSAWATTALDTAFILALVAATGGAASEFHLILYLLVLAIAFRFAWRHTVALSVVAAAAYAVIVGTLGPLASNLYEVAARSGLLVFEGVLAALLARSLQAESLGRARMGARAEAAERAEARFRGLLEAAPDGIVIVDSGGRIVLVNTEAERMFGYERVELLGRPVEMLVPERARGAHPGHRAGYMREPRTRPMGAGLELSARRKDGSEIPVEISLSPIDSPDGPLVTSVIRDVSDRRRDERELKRYADELERSNKELEQFAYVASHDLQEPLRMVASYLQLLAQRYRGRLDVEADEFIGYAVDGARRMQGLIQDLLLYSRVGTQGKPLVPTSAEGPFGQALKDLGAVIRETEASVTHEPLPMVPTDETQLAQVFQNLVGNALKFRGAEPPRVHVSAQRIADEWVFSVRDNGIGVDPRHKDRLFVIFQRLNDRSQYPGTGIGLAVCKKIVERHGGRIWVESEGLGKGATFRFSLPATPREAPRPPVRVRVGRPQGATSGVARRAEELV